MMCLRSRDSPEVGIKGMGMRRKSIFLLLKAKVHSVENVEFVGKSAGTGPKNARSAKGICTEVALVKVKGAIPVMVALPRCAIFVE